MKNTYFAFRTYSQSVTKYQMYRSTEGVECIGTFDADTATEALIAAFGRYDDANYFPNDDNTEITDCDGEVVWEAGDTMVDMRDYVYTVLTAEELESKYNENELKAAKRDASYAF